MRAGQVTTSWAGERSLRASTFIGDRRWCFIVEDRTAFVQGLFQAGQFGLDSFWGRILHPAKVSLREISDGSSLHVVIGRGNRVTVHLDSICPAEAGTRRGRLRYTARRVARHVRRDVLPLLLPHRRGAGDHALADVGWVIAAAEATTEQASGRLPRSNHRRAVRNR
jgi:hypothetical protein